MTRTNRAKDPPPMFIIEYFDRTYGHWRPMPADDWTDRAAEHPTAAGADLALARYRRRSPFCPMRVTPAAVPA